MSLSVGIVGLPNAGKSTLFNAMTQAGAAVGNYPFTTIEPNTGVVPVPDSRLDRLAALFQPPKVIPATVTFTDIAGLVRGASRGEGLGNRFLGSLRDCDAILYVLRSGCGWRHLPHDLPAWGTVYYYFRRWRREGVWDHMLAALRLRMRTKQGRDPEPSAAVIDSQSIKTSAVRGPEKGFDMGKKNLGAQTDHVG